MTGGSSEDALFDYDKSDPRGHAPTPDDVG
jgi:hypothetical protein